MTGCQDECYRRKVILYRFWPFMQNGSECSGMRAESEITPPTAFGLPEKFSSWRPGQYEATVQAIDSPRRFVAHGAPTGCGKTIIYMAHALMMGLRTCVLTSTKALQTQLIEDFRQCGLTDVRGQGNYRCKALWPGGNYYDKDLPAWMRSCEWGPCHAGLACRLKEGGCDYYDAYKDAQEADLVVTNYSYWLAIHAYGGSLTVRRPERDELGQPTGEVTEVNPFDLLVCDEAHSAPSELSSFLQLEFTAAEVEGLLGSSFPASEDLEVWQQWAQQRMDEIERRQEQLAGKADKEALKEGRALRRISKRLGHLQFAQGEWILDTIQKRKLWSPVWPGAYADLLFRTVPKVLLTSATVKEKTCEMLGIGAEELDFFEYPSLFPKERRPLISFNSSIPLRISHRSHPSHLQLWVARIDQILDRRQDRKGIIHTVSYNRRNFLMANSRHAANFLTHDPHNTEAVVSAFKRSGPPCVLISPCVGTGYDFPGEELEFSIIAKVPFPDSRSNIMRARCESDKDYSAYLAMQELVQASGRGMRSAQDRHEVLVVDDNIRWFLWKYKHFAPGWFLESHKTVSNVPDPPPKLVVRS